MELRDIVAKAIYESQVKQAIEHVDKINFHCHDLSEVFNKIKLDSRTGQVLVFGSYIEEKISDLIKARLHDIKSRDAQDRIFGSNGPLGTFGSRINMAYHLGWLQRSNKTRLNSFRRLRNEFAHNAYRIDPDNKYINSLIDSMANGLEEFLDPIFKILKSDHERSWYIQYIDLSSTDLLLSSMVFIIHEIIIDFLVLPSAVAFKVSPSDILRDFSTGPENVRKLNRCVSDAMLSILKRD